MILSNFTIKARFQSRTSQQSTQKGIAVKVIIKGTASYKMARRLQIEAKMYPKAGRSYLKARRSPSAIAKYFP